MLRRRVDSLKHERDCPLFAPSCRRMAAAAESTTEGATAIIRGSVNEDGKRPYVENQPFSLSTST